MKKVLIIAGLALIAACQPNGEGAKEKTTQHKHKHEHEHSGDSHVKLDNGKRWVANAETTEGIKNMMNFIYDFEAEVQTYEQLQEDLQNEFRMIFKKCTMTGEAHDQLHNYLIPLKEKIEKVSEENLSEIQDYLNTYKNYFR